MTICTKNWVAITGIGMTTPLGLSTEECWANMVLGKSGIGWITRFNTNDCLTRIAGQLPDAYFEVERQFFSSEMIQQIIYPVRLSMFSVRQAIHDAGFTQDRFQNQRVGVVTGSGGSVYNDAIMLKANDTDQAALTNIEMLDSHSVAISQMFEFKGPSFNVATACSSGAYAVGFAYDYVLRTGNPCLAVGVDTMIMKEKIVGFNQILAISENNEPPEKASRPFDKKRNGFVVSEGSCALFLEPFDSAKNRSARIYAGIAGYAATSEAYNIMAPEPDGIQMARVMSSALYNAGIPAERIGYINAHGTSTLYNDLAETKAIKLVFKDQAPTIPVSSQKSMIGHSIGGAGAIEAGVTALSLFHQIITPTINLDNPDPQCDLDYVPHNARIMDSLQAAISNSFAFGGHNCTLALVHARGIDV
jgi:3-oxoacyl-[acyl-carrier-protein] synthase II